MGALVAFLAQARNCVPQACALAPGSPVGLGFPQPPFIGQVSSSPSSLSPFAVILEPKKIKSVTVSIVSPSICYEVMGQDAMSTPEDLPHPGHEPASPASPALAG